MARRKTSSRSAKTRRLSRGDQSPVVLVLPGIMGSELKDTRGDDHIWIDPLGVLRGELALLRVADDGTSDADPSVTIEANDIINLYYDEIREALEDEGFDARHHPFDWRHNLSELAAQLADYID